MKSEIKERPGCRQAILNLGISPYLDVNGEWDGETALSRNGMRSDMSEGMRDQMRLMVAQGHWGGVKLKKPERWGSNRVRETASLTEGLL